MPASIVMIDNINHLKLLGYFLIIIYAAGIFVPGIFLTFFEKNKKDKLVKISACIPLITTLLFVAFFLNFSGIIK
jgi:Na+/proline symporter